MKEWDDWMKGSMKGWIVVGKLDEGIGRIIYGWMGERLDVETSGGIYYNGRIVVCEWV